MYQICHGKMLVHFCPVPGITLESVCMAMAINNYYSIIVDTMGLAISILIFLMTDHS